MEDQSSTSKTSSPWLTVLGERATALEQELESQVRTRVAAGEYTRNDIHYIEKIELKAIKGNLEVSNERLEKLRTLCRLFEVDLRPAKISSHRKIIGPCVVAAKKLVFPVMKIFLKDSMRQQRAFNAGVVALLADLCNEAKSTKLPSDSAQSQQSRP